MTLSLHGQELPRSITFEHLSIPGTVYSSEVIDILQDPEGLMWFAGDGLFRYDGSGFTQYKYLPDSSSIGSQEINNLMYDYVKRRILIATRNLGVVEFNYETNSLRKLPQEGGIPYFNDLAQTSDGKIWVTSFSSGLFYLENDTVKKVVPDYPESLNYTAPFAYGDQLILGLGPKFIFLTNGEITDSVRLSWKGEQFNYYGRITTFATDTKGNLYIGTEKQGMLVYNLEKKLFINHIPPERSPFYNRINQILIDRKGLVWILFKTGGVVVYNPINDQQIHLTKNLITTGSLSGDNCIAITEDKTGLIWIGSMGDVNIYSPEKIKFQHFTHNPLDKNSLSDKMVRGILEDDNGTLLVCTDGGFINRINPETGSVTRIKVTLPGYDGIIVPMHLLHLNSEFILVSSSEGVLLFNKKTRIFSTYEPLTSRIGRTMVRQSLLHENTLYLIARQRLYVHNMQTKKTDEYRNFNGDKSLLPATCLYMDSKDRLWVGVGQGISLMHPDNAFTSYVFEKNPMRPAGSYFMVLSIEEVYGKLWVGTFDSGLWLMDISNELVSPEIKKLTLPRTLQNTSIYASLPDNHQNVWLSTNHGILKFEPQENRFTTFSVSEGLQENEFNRLAYSKTKTGKIVFGGINGINIFDPDKISINSSVNSPRIVSLISDKEEDTDYFDLRDQSTVNLKASQNSIRINYVIADYQQPIRFTTQYILEPYERQWQDNLNHSAQYRNLKSGSYTFKVRVTNYDGSEALRSINVIIDHPYWQTWWFILLVLGGASGLIMATIKWYTAKTLMDKERLEFLLHERTKEIQKSREELESLNQKKDLIFSILSHDLRGPLTTLKGFLSLLIDNSDDLAKEDIKKHARSIRNSVTSSLDLIDNTLYWSLSQTGNISYSPTQFDLVAMLVKIHRLYQLTAEKKQIKFNLQLPKSITVTGDENMIFVALRNIVSNALKFTPEGKQVSISTHINQTYAVIQIKDEGIGMSKDYVEKILSDEQPRLKTGTSNEKGTGLGMVLCKKFISINQGSIQIKSIEQKGSEFTILLPLTDQSAVAK